MGSIKKQSIFNSLIIITGFLLGALNIYFLTNKHFFSLNQFAFFYQFLPAINIVLFSIGSLNNPFLNKFHPYYENKNNSDLFFISCVFTLIGGFIIALSYFFLKPILIYFFAQKSEYIQLYFNYFYISGLGFLIFNLFDSFSTINKNIVAPSFFKEIVLRIIIIGLICFFIFKHLSFDAIIKLFSFAYLIMAFIFGCFVKYKYGIKLNFKISTSTKSNLKNAISYVLPIYFGQLILQILINFDTFIITQILSFGSLALFAFGVYVAALLIIPQRSMANITTVYFSDFWKNNDVDAIQELNKKSANTLLYIALFIFGLIYINYESTINLLQLNENYLFAKNVFIFISLKYIFDIATGFNNTILNLSPKWSYEFWGSIIVMSVFIPIHYWACKNYGLLGLCIAGFINLSTLNIFRLFILYKYYKIYPFSIKNLYQILIVIIILTLFYFLPFYKMGLWVIILKSFLFSILYMSLNYIFNTTIVVSNILKKSRKKIFGLINKTN